MTLKLQEQQKISWEDEYKTKKIYHRLKKIQYLYIFFLNVLKYALSTILTSSIKGTYMS